MSILKGKKKLGTSADNQESSPSKANALAIALEIQGRRKSYKKMAKGGMVQNHMDADKKENYVQADIKGDEKHLMDMKPASPKLNPKSLYDEKQSKITSGSPDEASDHDIESESDMLRRHAEERAAHYARGGVVSSDDEGSEEDHPGSIAEAILRNRKAADSNEEGPGTHESFNIAAKGEDEESDEDFSYSDDGEIGDSEESEDENDHDSSLVSRIRKKMKK